MCTAERITQGHGDLDDLIFDGIAAGVITSLVLSYVWSWWWLIGVAASPLIGIIVLALLWQRRGTM